MSNSPVWHPFTQHGSEPPPPTIARAEGAWLYTADGRAILDGISSWWVTTHGHRHPIIMRAIREATETLDQIIFAGLTHAPAEAVARGVLALAPPGLSRVFFSDSGSTSVEVALKMALGTHRGARTGIAVMQGSYHGDTVGSMSIGARGPFNAAYESLLFDVQTIPFPEPGSEQQTLDRFAAISADRRLAALIIEPLVLGAGGMRMYPASVLRNLAEIARHTDTLLIADEVMTGWGRTGTLFACEQAGVRPDILCTSKGLTGGAIPLAATLATEAVYNAHLGPRAHMLFHSSSYTANPIACAAALANLQVWRDEDVQGRIAILCDRQQAHVARRADGARFRAARHCGTIAAFELAGAQNGYMAKIGPALRAHFLAHDVLLRPLGDVIYVMPPYCITNAELDRIHDTIDLASELFAA